MARVPVRMPKMSMTMTEGELSSWAVNVGDAVQSGDVICEVLTDKVDMEVESPATGTLAEIIVESGIVPVGEPIGWIEAEGDSFTDLLDFGSDEPAAASEDLGSALGDGPAPPPPGTAQVAAPPAPVAAPPAPPAGPVAAVPRARALAREGGVDLASVTPTGPGGVVSIEDVQRALGASAPIAPAVPAAEVPTVPTPAPAPRQPAPITAPTTAPAAALRARVVASDRAAGIRRAVARKMTESAAVPQFTVWRDLHLDEADRHRDGLSWTTVLLQTYSRALRRVPHLLTRWDGEAAADAGPPAVALAVDTGHGLLVPVFVEPDTVSARRLDEELRAVVGAARAGKVDPRYLAPANASLSNLGGLGVDRFQALVTPPQASVLALGTVGRRPVAVPGGVGTALVVTAGLTVDHRAADGADAARLLAYMAEDLG